MGSRTDLVEAALGGEDGDVAVVARARAAAHLAGRRKISPELGVVSGEGVLLCAALSWDLLRVHDYTPPGGSLFLFRKKKRARSGPTQTRPGR